MLLNGLCDYAVPCADGRACFIQANMTSKLFSYRVLCAVLAAVLVAVVIYYSSDAANQVTGILRYVPNVSVCLSSGVANIMQHSNTCVTGSPCTYSDAVDFRVVVITFNRAVSLSKLLRSLDTLVLDGHRAALEIWIDRDRQKNGVDQRTLEIASAFKWTGGPTRVHVQVVSLCFLVGILMHFIRENIVL